MHGRKADPRRGQFPRGLSSIGRSAFSNASQAKCFLREVVHSKKTTVQNRIDSSTFKGCAAFFYSEWSCADLSEAANEP